MSKLIITVTKDTKFIDDAFSEGAKEGYFKGLQKKMFIAYYKAKLSGLFKLVRTKCRDYITQEFNDSFVAEDSGTVEYCQKEKERMDRFLFGKENELKTESEYQRFKNDRMVHQFMRYLGAKANSSKDKAISLALGGDRVIDFFLRTGITIQCEIKEGGED